ncbi:hypothetical protein Taro_005083 [Colocasia esculenta]|uniref:Aminotransferase-like plant mobile domain-containing protein n=1 Tax=Colocasia esculenta TaxID=4460 RepID=A0A843TTG3_COLES|nr:hypothetical protein [Colocasia esculenta]
MALLGDVPDMMKRGSVKLSWLRERFAVIAEDASAEVVRRHARAYLLHLLCCTIFNDKTGNSVPLMYLPLLEDLDRATRYSWGGATLSYLYRQLSIAYKSDAKAICGSLTLLQVRWEPYTDDILQMLPAISRQASHLWLSRVPLISFSIVEMHVPDRILRQFGRVQRIPGPVDALDCVTRKGRGHIDWGRYFAHFVQIWHRRTDYIIPPDEKTVDIGRVEYMAWYWSITKRYIGRSGFTYDMRYEPRDHIERSLVDGMKHLHMMATDGLQDF